MRSSTRSALAGMGLIGSLIGCGETGPFEQDVSVVLTPGASTAVVGEQVSFRFDARGTALIGVIVDYGDMAVDTFELPRATEASRPVVHTYGAPGTFDVAATAVDVVVGRASDTATVTVTP